MGKGFTRFLSTIMLIGMLNGLTSCVTNDVVDAPVELGYSDWYSSGAQVLKIADELGAHTDRVLDYNPDKNGMPIRLAHKNGEAIEVAFHPEFEEFKSYAVDSLDYLFGIIGEINDNYKYKVVDFVGEHDHDIVFKIGEGKGYAGTTSVSSRCADDGVYNIEWGIIKIYKEAFASSSKKPEEIELEIRNTITHELMHALGFDDIYVRETNKAVTNTLINPTSQKANKYAQLHLTPDDYNNFLALYAKPSKNLEEDIEKYKAMSKAYEAEYYENWLLAEFESEQPPLESLNSQETYAFSQKCMSPNGSKEIDFSIEVDGDQYVFTVTDKSGKVLEQISGNVSYLTTSINAGEKEVNVPNSVMLIENIESKYLYTSKYYQESISEGSITNLFLYKSRGKYVLKDVFSFAKGEVVPESELSSQMQ